LFLTRSLSGKVKLTVVIVSAAAIAVVFIPSYSLYRYTTIFNDSYSEQDTRVDEAYGSSGIRKELLQERLTATLEHPLVGVGPGVYASAMAKQAEREGMPARWRVSHNTYTQVSAEMGIPGLVLYLAAIVSGYLDILWVRKQSRKNGSLDAIAISVFLSMIGLNVNFFFSSNAYMGYLPILLGLSAVLRINVQREIDQKKGIGRGAGAIRSSTAAGSIQKSSLPVRVPATSSSSQVSLHPTLTTGYRYRFLGRPRGQSGSGNKIR